MAKFIWGRKVSAASDVDVITQGSKEDSKLNNSISEFDLNIEKILENWEVYHAVREIIANALDEQILTGTKNIEIIKKNNSWHVIDYGRGLNYHHLTQNENKEKLDNDKLIGRFGVGLKDALATLYRHKIDVRISSKYGIITLIEAPKSGFDDIVTLHAKIDRNTNKNMVGTDIELLGCQDGDIEKAKSLFLEFSNGEIVETTKYGQVISKVDGIAHIYINGVKVAEENNFLFSYNITSLTKQIKKSLNRERTNVGRTAYSDRVKSILLSCEEESVIKVLVDDLQKFNSGLRHDELLWNDIELHASKKIRDFRDDVIFITSDTGISSSSLIDEIKEGGFTPLVLSEASINKINDYNSSNEDDIEPIKTTKTFISEMEENMKYTFVEEYELSSKERMIYSKKDEILKLIGGKPNNVRNIRISETIYESEMLRETVGIWDKSEGLIVIKRNQLKSIEKFAGTLIHECIHARSGAADVNREFESGLTEVIGALVGKIVV